MEENNYEIKDQPKKKKKLWIGVLVAILSILIIGVAIGGESEQPAEQTTTPTNDNVVGARELDVSDLEMIVEYNDLLDRWDVTITGKAKNVSSKNYSYASVDFSVYDAEGNNLGSATASMNNLASGETWSFEATWFESPKEKPISYKLSDVTTW